MVLKNIFLTFFLLFFSFGIYAKTFRQAKMYYSKKNYKRTLLTIKSLNKTEKRRHRTEILLMIALSYHKLNQPKPAIQYFNQYIKAKYRRKDVQIQKAFRDDDLDADELKPAQGLLSIYYYLGMEYLKLYNTTEKKEHHQNARKNFVICDELEYKDNGKSARMIKKVDEVADYIKRTSYSTNFNIYVGRSFWQEKLILVPDSSANSEINLLANNSGPSFGLTIRMENGFRGYEVQTWVALAEATVREKSGSAFEYKQAHVPTMLIGGEVGYYIRPHSPKTRLGISLAALSRAGNYTEPTGYTVYPKQTLQYGAMLNATWEVSPFELIFKMGHFNLTNLTSLAIAYQF